MQKTTLLVVLLLSGLALLTGQSMPDKGLPLLQNYTPVEFGTAGKIWSIQSADNGLVYFATDKGLLEFDGVTWKRFPGSKGLTRSVLLLNDSIGYTGADKDFGRWQRTPQQAFEYTSLNPFRESTKGLNQEFWGTYRIDEDIVFVSFDNIYVYKEAQLTQIAAPSRFTGSFFSGGLVYVADQEEGLLRFDGLRLRPVTDLKADFPTPPLIVGVHDAPDHTLLVTREQGIYRMAEGQLTPVSSPVTPYLKRDQVFSFTAIDSTHYAFGTILNGVYITDRRGNIIQHINKQKGLLNNTVLAMHYSPQGKLWIGMDFGIAAINLWSDVAYFVDQGGKVGTGHTALLHEGTFYLGTNQGLYTIGWEDLRNDRQELNFSLVPGSSGQVWALDVVAGTVFCGHDRGLFAVRGRRLQPVSTTTGILALRELPGSRLLAGTYNGIALFQQRGADWEFVHKLTPIQGACSQLVTTAEGDLWVNLPNFGVIRAQLNPDYTIREQTIYPLTDFADEPVQLIAGTAGIAAITKTTIYTFQSATRQFTSSPAEQQHQRIRHLLPTVFTPLPLNQEYGFYPVHNGFALQRQTTREPEVVTAPLWIRSVRAFSSDSTLQVVAGSSIPYRLHNLRMTFVIPQLDHVRYQYLLEGLSTDWSKWSAVSSAEYMGLPAGAYTFRVRAAAHGTEIAEQEFRFTISPPWYQSPLAYACFISLLLAFFYLNYRWQQHALKKQEARLRQQEQADQQEQIWREGQQNLKKRYATLEDALDEAKKQLRSKTIELARKAKESEEKGRLLQALKEKIEALEEAATSNKFRWSQISRMLEAYPDGEDSSFDLQLEELNKDFIATLSQQYPELTAYDLRLSTYLKAGLSTREIASHLNVLPSSVNVSRSRLRKKLQLDSKTDLYKFLNQL